MAEIEFHLLNDFQRHFPLEPEPFAVIAGRLGTSESEVLRILNCLQACGKISRVGAVFKPHTLGSSTLAALSVPAEELDEVAQLVNSYVEVNHNYEREHRFNLWFVVTAATEARVQEVLEEIGHRTGYQPLHLPMIEDFHIDLGFDLSAPHKGTDPDDVKGTDSRKKSQYQALSERQEIELAGAIQKGFPLVSRPFAEVGAGIGMNESEVIAGLGQLIGKGIIKRMGVVVRHRELGYRANAMVVWDIPNDQVRSLGQSIGSSGDVTLCYRRPRRLPIWRYNLFTMIHGRRSDEVLERVEQLKEKCGLKDTACAVLFSRRCFKQRGAQYVFRPLPELAGSRYGVSANAA